MKKIIFLLPLLFLVVFPKGNVFADEGSQSAMVSPTIMMTNYTLPYPGILPDNPLYSLKTLRDSVITFFISDPLKKSTFFLLQSDKRIAASWYLVKEGQSKDALALTTLSKSTNYLSQAVDQVSAAKKSGEDVNAEIDSLKNATAKHMTTVNKMLVLKGLTNKTGFQQELQRLEDLEKVVSRLSSN